jgi:hypothetical protein
VRKFVLPAVVAAAVGFAFLPSAARADGVPCVGTGGYYAAPSYPSVTPSYTVVPPTCYNFVPSYYQFSYRVYPSYNYHHRYYHGSRYHYRGHRGHGHHRR